MEHVCLEGVYILLLIEGYYIGNGYFPSLFCIFVIFIAKNKLAGLGGRELKLSWLIEYFPKRFAPIESLVISSHPDLQLT